MYPVYPTAHKITIMRITTRIIKVTLSTKRILLVKCNVAGFTTVIDVEKVCSDVTILVVDIVFWVSVAFLIEAVVDGGYDEVRLVVFGGVVIVMAVVVAAVVVILTVLADVEFIKATSKFGEADKGLVLSIPILG